MGHCLIAASEVTSAKWRARAHAVGVARDGLRPKGGRYVPGSTPGTTKASQAQKWISAQTFKLVDSGEHARGAGAGAGYT
jgi:hypothetical protein